MATGTEWLADMGKDCASSYAARFGQFKSLQNAGVIPRAHSTNRTHLGPDSVVAMLIAGNLPSVERGQLIPMTLEFLDLPVSIPAEVRGQYAETTGAAGSALGEARTLREAALSLVQWAPAWFVLARVFLRASLPGWDDMTEEAQDSLALRYCAVARIELRRDAFGSYALINPLPTVPVPGAQMDGLPHIEVRDTRFRHATPDTLGSDWLAANSIGLHSLLRLHVGLYLPRPLTEEQLASADVPELRHVPRAVHASHPVH